MHWPKLTCTLRNMESSKIKSEALIENCLESKLNWSVYCFFKVVSSHFFFSLPHIAYSEMVKWLCWTGFSNSVKNDGGITHPLAESSYWLSFTEDAECSVVSLCKTTSFFHRKSKRSLEWTMNNLWEKKGKTRETEHLFVLLVQNVSGLKKEKNEKLLWLILQLIE